MSAVRWDLCPNCSEPLDWHFDPMVDGGKCPKCKNIFYPIESEDLNKEVLE